MLLQLLLLAATWPGLHAGLLDSYIIDPVSYLDVVRPLAADQVSAGLPDQAPCSSSSSGPTCSQGASRLLQDDLPAQGQATQLSTYAAVAGDVLPAHSRGLQQVPANPLRFQAPYKVCVSSWVLWCDASLAKIKQTSKVSAAAVSMPAVGVGRGSRP